MEKTIKLNNNTVVELVDQKVADLINDICSHTNGAGVNIKMRMGQIEMVEQTICDEIYFHEETVKPKSILEQSKVSREILDRLECGFTVGVDYSNGYFDIQKRLEA